MADLAAPDPGADWAVPRDNSEDIRRVREAFQQSLGRDAGSDQSVIDDHLRGDVYRTGGIDAVLGSIRNSEEARNRTAGSSTGVYGTTPYTDRGSGTGADDWAYTGYDFGQDPANRQIGKSAKYTLAEGQRIAKAAGATDTWRTKTGAADFANQHLKKYLEDNGFEVLDIVGDKIKMRDHADRAAGREGSWVDWVVGADGANPQLGFQVEQTQAAFGAPETYRPKGFSPTVGGPRMPGVPDPNAARAQVQDRYGRSPGHPNYGLPPQPGETGLLDPATGAPINPAAYTPLAAPMSDLGYPEVP
jgi:hypothetical protein